MGPYDFVTCCFSCMLKPGLLWVCQPCWPHCPPQRGNGGFKRDTGREYAWDKAPVGFGTRPNIKCEELP